MANLISRTVFTGTLTGSDIFYGITDPGGTPAEWKIPLSKLAALYATAAQGVKADTAVQPASLALVATTGAYADLSGTPTLGTIASQNANSVSISGGSITGITDLAIADGGTGQGTAQAAIDALTAVAAATNEHVLTKDTATGNAIFKAGGSSLPVVDETAIVFKTGSPAITQTHDINAYTTARTITWPNAAGTPALLGVVNEFTVNQQINGARLNLKELTFNNIMYFEPTSAGSIFTKILGNGKFIIDVGSTNGGLQVQNSGGTPFFEVLGNAALALSTLPSSTTAAANALRMINRAKGNNSGTRALWQAFNSNDNIKDLISIDGTWVSNTQGSEETRLVISLNQGDGGGNSTLKEAIKYDSSTGIFEVIRTSRSSVSVAAGFGPILSFQGESSTTNNQLMARCNVEWVVETHASRTARVKHTAYDTAEREYLRGEASGTAPMLGVLGAAAIARQAHIADPSGGGTQDAEARTAINAILLALESFGFLATS